MGEEERSPIYSTLKKDKGRILRFIKVVFKNRIQTPHRRRLG